MSLASAPMLMMQYAFALPGDYPMRTVRERIASRGPQFDQLPGLGWKAFLVREKGVAGATDNQYAPLYLWRSAPAASTFLAGPFFAAVSAAFGRPRVATSLLLGHREDPPTHRPRWCTTEQFALRSLIDLPGWLGEFGRDAPEALHSEWLALDPSRWMVSRHRLWRHEEPPEPGDALLFEVAHVSRPS
jgi:hypothetical protein